MSEVIMRKVLRSEWPGAFDQNRKRGIKMKMRGLILFLILSAMGLAAVSDGRAEGELRSRILSRIRDRQASNTAAGPAVSGALQRIGYQQVATGKGLKIAVWYPTDAREEAFAYGTRGTESVLAPEAPVKEGGRYPLIVFSHGFHGCGVQSVFLTETLARAGYVVAAPDHQDASCGKNGEGSFGEFKPQEKFGKPGQWSESTYADRGDDIKDVIDEMTRSAFFGPAIDAKKIGLAGHSLGGYTVLGVSGAWAGWKDGRVKAVLAMSPGGHPFLLDGRIKGVDIPVMYQGADRDIFLTPMVGKEGGLYELSNSPKYFLQLKRVSHFAWSNLSCGRVKEVSRCIQRKDHLRLINDYAMAFFGRYLKGEAASFLERGNERLTDYRWSK